VERWQRIGGVIADAEASPRPSSRQVLPCRSAQEARLTVGLFRSKKEFDSLTVEFLH